MDKETIHEQIDILIETLKEQHEGMKKHPNYISQIDVDLFLENIRDLYEFATVLGKMNDRGRKQNQGSPKNEMPVLAFAEPIVQTTNDYPKSSSKEKKINKLSSGVLFEDFAVVEVDIKVKEEPIILQKEAISDMRIAIGINDKFVFMNELFDGSLEEYNASIDLLNNCQNASDAEQHIYLELQPKYHWDMNSVAVKSLLDLVTRRFI